MTKEKKVGLFVLLGVAISVVAVGLIGENRKFWERKVVYTTRYGDVAGLAAGSPVRMGGMGLDLSPMLVFLALEIFMQVLPR